MKSIQDWLQELPDGYRELALANHNKPDSYNFEVKSLSAAVIEFIDWSKTNEGGKFWMGVSDYIDGDRKELPPLPVPKVDERDERIAQLTASNNSLAAALSKRYMDNCEAGQKLLDIFGKMNINVSPKIWEKEIKDIIKSLSN